MYGKPPQDLDEMDSHFSNLKAKIKLKTIKMYKEDVQTQKEIEEKAKEIPIVVKDNMGRVMERVYPKMRERRIPNVNRHPMKRAPLKRKKSFTD